MNIMELKKSLSENNLNNLYIFYGEEYAIIDAYIKMVCNHVNGNVLKSDNVSQIYKSLNTKSLLSTNEKTVYVIREDSEFSTNEKLWNIYDKLKSKNIILILKYSNIDSRGKFSKHFEQYITKFDKLSEEILMKYVKKDLDLNDNYCKYLVQICSYNYGKILLEINKLKNLSKYYKLSDNDCFKLAVNGNLFYQEPENVINELVEAIMFKNISQIYKLYEEFKEHNDNDLLLLSYLHNAVKALLQIKTVGENSKLSETTGLQNFQIKNSLRYIKHYTCEQLVEFLRYIKYCDNSYKNGDIPSDMVIDYLLVNIL